MSRDVCKEDLMYAYGKSKNRKNPDDCDEFVVTPDDFEDICTGKDPTDVIETIVDRSSWKKVKHLTVVK
jgi:hypothetical protein